MTPTLVDNFVPIPYGEMGHGMEEYAGNAVENYRSLGRNFRWLRRPFIDDRGRAAVIINTGQWTVEKGERVPIRRKQLIMDLLNKGRQLPPVCNAASLRKEQWQELDERVVRATRLRMKAWPDLVASSSRGGINGMGTMTIEYQAMTDPGEAVVDMDAISDARRDRPLFNLKSIPLPITHSDFFFSEREIEVSHNKYGSGFGLDTTMAEAAGRRIGEMIEKTTIGIETGVTYGTITTGPGTMTGTSTVYGYTNFPYRITKTNLTTPTGANPDVVNRDVATMVELAQAQGFFGPYVLYHSTGYTLYLNDDYFRTGSTSAVRSLRSRILENEDIRDIRRLDFLTTGYQLILVQMNDPEVAQAVIGMDTTVVQWDSQGGMRKNFKVMAIKVPLLKSPYNGIAGIVHGTTS